MDYIHTNGKTLSTPEIAEDVLSRGSDFVSLARPFLADPLFAVKARENKSESINVCIGCNVSCLVKIF